MNLKVGDLYAGRKRSRLRHNLADKHSILQQGISLSAVICDDISHARTRTSYLSKSGQTPNFAWMMSADF